MLDLQRKWGLLWNRRGGHDLSKKRLYEIAKELGKESKEVVARAKELGLMWKATHQVWKKLSLQKLLPALSLQLLENRKVAAKPQSRNFKAEREARAKEQAERRKQNKGNNRDQQQNGNRQKTTAVMVENKVKATATIVALMTKLRSSKVSKNVEMSAVSKRINVQIKRLHVLTLKPVQQP